MLRAIMTPADYVILAIIAVSAIAGIFRGFLRECVSLVSWVVALWVAWRHSDLVTPYLGGALAAEPFRTWAARVLIALAILMLGALVGLLAGQFMRVSMFSGFDRFLGFLFGLLRGVVVLGVVVLIATQLRLDGEKWWRKSQLMPYAEAVAGIVGSAIGDAGRVTRASGASQS
jgi:membrane protein required for colicin V production